MLAFKPYTNLSGYSMKQSLLILITVSLFSFQQKVETVLFHEYSPTSSSWDITKWNILDTSDVRFVLEETVDWKGRVTELRYLDNGEIYADPLCYLPTRVTFSYDQNTITETLYHGREILLTTDCEMSYKKIYHLNSNYIERIETFSKYDSINVPQDIINQLKKVVPEYTNYTCSDSVNTSVEYYIHSYAKLNSIYPVNHGYRLDQENHFYGGQPEREAVENTLINRNNR